MDLRNQILPKHTKANCQLIIDWIGNQEQGKKSFKRIKVILLRSWDEPLSLTPLSA